jgi:predicted acyl esterase
VAAGACSKTPFYLPSEGAANTLSGDGLLQPKRANVPGQFFDQFTYDPRNPVPRRGGAVCCDPKIFPWGPMDQRPVEKRKDVLVHSSAPLRQARIGAAGRGVSIDHPCRRDE